MALDLKVYVDGKIYLSTNRKEDIYNAIVFLVREAEKLEIRGGNEVTVYDIKERANVVRKSSGQ